MKKANEKIFKTWRFISWKMVHIILGSEIKQQDKGSGKFTTQMANAIFIKDNLWMINWQVTAE